MQQQSMIIKQSKYDTVETHSWPQWHVQESTIFFDLPPTTAAKARAMFKVSDDDKLRVRDPLHKQFEWSTVKAFHFVIEENSVGKDMDPEALLHACVNNADTIELTSKRDLGNNVRRREIERESVCDW